METFSALLAIYAGNSMVTGEFSTQRPVTRSFDVSLICAWINDWVNNRETGDLRRHRAHYDVTLMITQTYHVASDKQISRESATRWFLCYSELTWYDMAVVFLKQPSELAYCSHPMRYNARNVFLFHRTEMRNLCGGICFINSPVKICLVKVQCCNYNTNYNNFLANVLHKHEQKSIFLLLKRLPWDKKLILTYISAQYIFMRPGIHR